MIDTTAAEKRAAADLQQYKELYLAGKSQTEIANITGFSLSKCSRLKKKLGDQQGESSAETRAREQFLTESLRHNYQRFVELTDKLNNTKLHTRLDDKGKIDNSALFEEIQCLCVEGEALARIIAQDGLQARLPDISGALIDTAHIDAIIEPLRGELDTLNNELDELIADEYVSTESADAHDLTTSYFALLTAISALKGYLDTLESFRSAVAANEKKQQRQQRRQEEKAKLQEARDRAKEQLFYQPTGAAILQTVRILEAGNKIDELPEHESRISSSRAEMSVYNKRGYKEETRFVEYKHGNNSVTTRVEDIGEISGNNLSAIMTFLYALTTAGQEAIFSDGSTRQCFTVYYHDLAALGIYSSEDAARHQAFDAALKLQQLTIIDGHTGYKGKKSIIMQPENLDESLEDAAGFFSIISRIKNGIRFTLNPSLNWREVISGYAPLPAVFFGLPVHAALVLFHVCQLLQLRSNKIKKEREFTVSLRTVAAWLFLPHESETSNPTAAIKNPIFNAVETIDDADTRGLYLEIVEPGESYTITKFLDKGKLKIIPEGEVLGRVLNKRAKKDKAIAAKEQRERRIEEKSEINVRTKIKEKRTAGATTAEATGKS